MKIGLALSAGAARGLAHVGVVKVLIEHDIPIDVIAGTSAGAMIGAAFASGLTVPQVVELARKVRWTSLGRFAFSRFGIFSMEPMRNYIAQNIPAKRFEDLKIPFACVATDLNTGDAVVMKERGDLATAITASCAVPALYVPITVDGRQLVDGGIVEFIPADTARGMGADIVIAVDVNFEEARFGNQPQTAIGVFAQSALLLLKTAARYQTNSADIVIRPPVSHLRVDQVGRAKDFIETGEQATRAKIDDIKRLIKA